MITPFSSTMQQLPYGLTIGGENVSSQATTEIAGGGLNFQLASKGESDTEPLSEITKSFGIIIRDGQIMVSSREVARVFGKKHKNVLQSIDLTQCSDRFREQNYEASAYIDEQGKKRREYYMTRDGFTFMVMGFTGHVAAEFKEAYIEAFNVMEKALGGRQDSV